MNILVTGGAGYIGSTVAQQLSDAGHRVTVYDNLSSGHLAAVPAGAAFVRGEAHQPETHLLPLVLQVALGQRENIAVFGDDYPTPDGTCVRDYIHIEDLASAHVLALHALDERPFMRYNLGNGAGYSVLEVIETARRVTGHPIPAVVRPRRAGDPAMLIAGSGKIQAELGWQPQHPDLAEITASAWQWHLAHPRGYEDGN